MTNFLDTLKEIVKEELLGIGGTQLIEDIYLFGSSITSKVPNDIDILIVYKDTVLVDNYKIVIRFRDSLSKRVLKSISKPTDIILLNQTEFANTDYYSLRKMSLK